MLRVTLCDRLRARTGRAYASSKARASLEARPGNRLRARLSQG